MEGPLSSRMLGMVGIFKYLVSGLKEGAQIESSPETHVET